MLVHSRSYIDPEKAKIQCAMLPGIAEMSNKDPVELERLAPQSTRKTPKPVILNDKKEYVLPLNQRVV